jgi:hypothetical protein
MVMAARAKDGGEDEEAADQAEAEVIIGLSPLYAWADSQSAERQGPG